MSEPLWRPRPERVAQSHLSHFMEEAETDWNITLGDYGDVWRWSVAAPDRFWQSVKDYAQISAETWGDAVIEDPLAMPGARFFPGARLNFAENLLRRRDDADALVFRGEDKVNRRLSHAGLYDQVSLTAQALARLGVEEGDRVVAMMPNMPETIIFMLAASSLGAIWSSCSPDFGVQGVLDRFGQVEPVLFLAPDGYYYNGKAHDVRAKAADIAAALPSLKQVVIVPYIGAEPDVGAIPGAVTFGEFVAGLNPRDIDFVRLPFNHPLCIMFSSGTTGVPKCIVHGAGGTLLTHMKEHLLNCDIHPDDRVFYFTTCGWMMWNWLVSALASQATLLLYDGSPFYPDGNVLFDFARDEGMTLFGTAAKFLSAIEKAGLRPDDTHDLSSLRAMTSTGSTLAPESFDFVYDAIKSDLHLASISGGTDIIACFVLGDPTGPVWRGEIQRRALGMAVDVFDDNGRPVRGEKGELVCTAPFPSMPLGFWNDPGDVKYLAAYFEKIPGIWTHGDWVELSEHDGIIIHGRSDATLNPGGVRIGTAEIYRQVEKLDEVVESIVIGQDWEDDTRVVLFVVLRPGLDLDGDLVKKIRQQIFRNCSPRHVPARVVQVSDIPRTKSGKITELTVRDMVHGRPVKNKEALANPEALALFADRPELQD